MANEEHNSLTGSALHENKGVASATDNTVATAVTGATVWAKLTADNLTGTGNPFGGQLFHVRDQKSAGTDGGTFTSGAWRTRTLNTTVVNEISGASLASNQITLPSGTYRIEAHAPAQGAVSLHKAKLRNVTDGSDTTYGTVARTSDTANHVNWSSIRYTFTIASAKVFEIQHYGTVTENTVGFGEAMGLASEPEIYTDVLIYKIA